LGFGVLGQPPNPQSPIPNPQYSSFYFNKESHINVLIY
jgi:hypothetical protein